MVISVERSDRRDLKSTIREVCQFSAMEEEELIERISERHDVGEREVAFVIEDMIDDGDLFRPDSKSIQRM